MAWIRRFIVFHSKRHPVERGAPEVTKFLTSLAVDGTWQPRPQNGGAERPPVPLPGRPRDRPAVPGELIEARVEHEESCMVDLNMLVITRERERTQGEYETLLRLAGSFLTCTVPTVSPLSLIEAGPSRVHGHPGA